MHVSAPELAIILTAVVVGALVQGSIGFGLNLVVVPVAALVEPDALPATMIMMALPMTIAMMVREHDHIDWSGVGWLTVGRLPGTAIGAWVVTAVSADALSQLIGVLVVVAVAMSATAPPLPVSPTTAAGAGFASGAMGTASSIGGPPVALLYQHHPGPALRSTMATAFMIGIVLSLAALVVAGEVAGWQVRLALALVPGVGLGVWLSGRLHRWLDAHWLRPLVLTFATLAGLAALARGLL